MSHTIRFAGTLAVAVATTVAVAQDAAAPEGPVDWARMETIDVHRRDILDFLDADLGLHSRLAAGAAHPRRRGSAPPGPFGSSYTPRPPARPGSGGRRREEDEFRSSGGALRRNAHVTGQPERIASTSGAGSSCRVRRDPAACGGGM